MEGRTTVTGARHIINVNVVLGSWTPDKDPSSYLFLYSVDSSSFGGEPSLPINRSQLPGNCHRWWAPAIGSAARGPRWLNRLNSRNSNKSSSPFADSIDWLYRTKDSAFRRCFLGVTTCEFWAANGQEGFKFEVLFLYFLHSKGKKASCPDLLYQYSPQRSRSPGEPHPLPRSPDYPAGACCWPRFYPFSSRLRGRAICIVP